MQSSLTNQTPSSIARVITFATSSAVAGIGFGVGGVGLALAFNPKQDEYCLAHVFGSLINVPATAVGSLAMYPALLALGLKNHEATQMAGSIFGCTMLANSLSHWVSLKNDTSGMKDVCVGMGIVTGILGLATLAVSLRE